MRWFLSALAVGAALLGLHLSAGGAHYRPTAVADPCQARAWRQPDGAAELAEQIALSALDGAACDLGVPREELVLALESRETLRAFGRARGLDEADLEDRLRSGLHRAVADARRADAIGAVEAAILDAAVDRLPLDALLDAIEGRFVW